MTAANNPDPGWLDETTEDFVWPGDLIAADLARAEALARQSWAELEFAASVLADIDELGGVE